MVRSVNLPNSTWNQSPSRFEAGTPNVEGVIGLVAALTFLMQLGINNVETHTAEISSYAYTELATIPEVALLSTPSPASGIISFTVKGIHPHDIADLLGKKQICIRAGHHCAQPLHQKLGIAASCRISIGIYNDRGDIDTFVTALKEIIEDISHA
jgi:cysteine desulfurase/selenocysteine lyase